MDVLLTLHILAAVIWVGGGVTLHVLGRIAGASGDRRRMNEFSETAEFLGPRLYAPLSMLLLVMGILLVDKAGYEQSDAFVGIGYAGWIASFLIGVLYYPRAGKRRAEIVAGDGIDSPAFLANYRQAATVSTVEITILLLVVVAMGVKPGV